jgi:aryl-alcohol dehydrogenase-like predicted oxidoreductase
MVDECGAWSDFSHTELPHLGTRVLRLGVAGNYGLEGADVEYAAERGVNYWVWTPRFRKVTPVLSSVLRGNRDQHVVAMMGTAYTAGMARKAVDKALRMLDTDYLDVFQLSWLGRGSFYSQGIQDVLVGLRDSGKVRVLGCSIHDRKRAGELARESILDAFMIRYNAAHPGAEQDIFPHLHHRDPLLVSYTATSWRQLLKPVSGIEGGPLTAAECYRFVLSSPHVHVALTGPADRAQLDENLAVLDAGPLTAEEDARIREYGLAVKSKKKIPFM